ncbi:MAG TPA: thiamine pyrophosphate-dependent enzyme [Gemmataceae bacterium]|nr:thiamine pyrophosphate-dependent enzyme [Gemmataceae bacterium]
MSTTTMRKQSILQREHGLVLLREMLLIRRFEEKCAERYAVGEIHGFLHLFYIGDEAVVVGAMQALTPDDNVVSTYREHGHTLARGLSAASVMAEMYGKANGEGLSKDGHVSRLHGVFGVGQAVTKSGAGARSVTCCDFAVGPAPVVVAEIFE